MDVLESKLYPRVQKEKYQDKQASRILPSEKSHRVYVKGLKKQINLQK